MTASPSAPITAAQLLDQPVRLSRAASPRALDALVAQERTRQDGRLAALRKLREQAEHALGAVEPPAFSGGIGARLGALLRRRRAASPTTERSLRLRFEAAQLRARRALAFAETLGELSRELVAEGERLRGLLAELAQDDATLDELLRGLRALDHQDEHVTRRAYEHEALRDAVRAAEDRLLRLTEGERMLLLRVDALRAEVERGARDATRRLDEVGAALRTQATSDDSERVLGDLQRSLTELFGVLDASTREVHEEARRRD